MNEIPDAITIFIYCGDFFAISTTAEQVKPVDSIATESLDLAIPHHLFFGQI